MMLFDMPDVSDIKVEFWRVLVPAVAGVAVFAGLAIFAIGRTFLRPQTAGTGELIGLVGRSDTELAPEGRVFVRGEYWTARSDQEIPANAPVEVTAVEGMRLRVRPAPEV